MFLFFFPDLFSLPYFFPRHVFIFDYSLLFIHIFSFAQSAGVVEYNDCISAKRYTANPNEYPGYDTKQSDGEVPVMLELWGMQSTPSLPSLLGPLLLGVVAPDSVIFMGQIELNCVLILNSTAWNRTVLIFKLRTNAKLNCLK